MCHPAGLLRVHLVTATKYECVRHRVHSTTRRLIFPSGKSNLKLNQLSAHAVNFISKQLNSVFTPKAEITGLADHSIIKKSPENEQTWS